MPAAEMPRRRDTPRVSIALAVVATLAIAGVLAPVWVR